MNVTNLRTILHDELQSRKVHNPGYSLRAFARDLGTSAARLSQILNDKSGASAEFASQIADALKFNDGDRELVVEGTRLRYARGFTEREEAKRKIKARLAGRPEVVRSIEKFQKISKWYFLAILELTETADFVWDEIWIATRLGIPKSEASAAMKVLIDEQCVKKVKRRWQSTEPFATISSEIPQIVIQQYHRQMLSLSEKAISSVGTADRELNSMIMSVRSEDLPKLKKALRELMKNFNHLATDVENKDRVYALNLQFIPLTQTTGEKR